MNEARWMRRCLELADRAAGRTSPNPLVGAVVLRAQQVVGEGWHERAGAPHAEVVALARAGAAAQGATLYVNLEPCCHQGRTPPCTDAIVRAGISRVVVGMPDPNPRVAGRGIERLRAAGVQVELSSLESDCMALNRAFTCAMTQARPLVVLKAAATLDGRIATTTGESRWITGPQAREHVHRLRDRHDAVLVGSGTALADDPRLDTRRPGGRDAVPVLLDSRLRVPPSAQVFAAGRRALVYSCAPPPADHPATVVRVEASSAGVQLQAVLADLCQRGLQSVLVEGGGEVHRAFLDAGLVDRVLLYLAPRILAGGPGWVAGPGIARLSQAWQLRLLRSEQLGEDLLLELERRDT